MPTPQAMSEDAEPVAAIGERHRHGDVLGDRRRRGEGDVDAAGDQHDQQPGAEDADEGVRGEQVEEVLQREEAVGRQRQDDAEHEDDEQQPELVAAAGSAAKAVTH